MKHGSYRGYFHIFSIGIKFARLDFSVTNTLAVFLSAIIMNLLERKRYLYYVKQEPVTQWGKKWKYSGDDIALNPTYFSCGLFNIVRHVQPWNSSTCIDWKVLYKNRWVCPRELRDREEIDLTMYSELHNLFNGLVEFHSSAHGNVGIWDKDKLVAIDYGDFNVDKRNSKRVSLIDIDPIDC